MSAAPAVRRSSLRLLPAELVANLEAAPYRYASTMGGLPHYYTLRREWEDPRQFQRTVKAMREHEVLRPFYSKSQRYLDVNGFQYWTMGASHKETTLINRQFCWHGAYASEFDAVAQSYDLPWGTPRALQKEREEFYELARPAGSVLDVGCGAGLPVDYQYKKIDRERYVGIDPSFGMLAKFKLKHPDYDEVATLLRTTFEDYETTLRFDTIVAMFGSASHVIGTDLVAKVRHLLAPGGRAILTFYRHPEEFYRGHGLGKLPELAPSPEGTTRHGDYDALEFLADD